MANVFGDYPELKNTDSVVAKQIDEKVDERKKIVKQLKKMIKTIRKQNKLLNQLHGENDCTLLYEDYAIVFEDKSGRVNRNTHKGLLKSAYKDNKKLIEEASEQASLFANLLEKNLGKELTLKVKGGVYNVIDLKKTKHILKIGIVFEETILQNMTLGNKKHSPIVSIFQLNKIF